MMEIWNRYMQFFTELEKTFTVWHYAYMVLTFILGASIMYDIKPAIDECKSKWRAGARPRVLFNSMYYDTEAGEEVGRKLISVGWFFKE